MKMEAWPFYVYDIGAPDNVTKISNHSSCFTIIQLLLCNLQHCSWLASLSVLENTLNINCRDQLTKIGKPVHKPYRLPSIMIM